MEQEEKGRKDIEKKGKKEREVNGDKREKGSEMEMKKRG